MEGLLIYLLCLLLPFLIIGVIEREQTKTTYHENNKLKTKYIYRNFIFSKKCVISDKGWYKNGQLKFKIEYRNEKKSKETRYFEDGQIDSIKEHQLPILLNTIYKRFNSEGNITNYVGFKTSMFDEYGSDKYSEESKSKIFIQPNIEELRIAQFLLKNSNNGLYNFENHINLKSYKFDYNDIDYLNDIQKSIKRGYWIKNHEYEYDEGEFYVTITKK